MLLDLALLVGLAWGAGALVGRLGYPPVLGELAAGVLFGPPVLGVFGPVEAGGIVEGLATLGVILLMLLAGLRADPASVVGHAPSALAPALAGLGIPMGLGVLAVLTVGGGTVAEGLTVGAVLGVTALATVSRVLIDLDLLGSPIGERLLCVALLEVILVLVTFAVVFGAVGPGSESFAVVAVKAALFLGGAVAVGSRLLTPIGQAARRLGLLEGAGGFTFAVVLAVTFAGLSDLAGLTIVPGAFLAGLFLGPSSHGPRLGEASTSVRDAGVGLLTPIFFFTAGFAADLGVLVDRPLLVFTIVGAGFGGKVLAGALGGRATQMPWRDGLLLGVGMNGRGGIDVILAGTALGAAVISPDLFTALVLTTFLTTLPMPVLLQRGVAQTAAVTARSPA